MKPSHKKAFTLIELAAAFAVFSLILLAVGAMVQQSSDGWRDGLDSVAASDEGRAFTDEIFRDITAAICTSNFPFIVTNDRLYMISGYRRYSNGTSDLGEVAYYLRADGGGRNTLIRRNQNVMDNLLRAQYDQKSGARNTTNKIKSLPFWGQGPDANNAILARNVRAFRVVCYDEGNNRIGDYSSFDRGNKLPARVEVTLEILPEDAWRKKDKGSGDEEMNVEIFSMAISPTQQAY